MAIFFKKILQGWCFPLIILLVGLISYYQLLEMNFWQDDNAVVFKFTHINEEAGYLGKGIFGEGPYRYTITPYYPIFKFFGYQPWPYFALALVFFLLSALAIYYFYNYIFEDKIYGGVAGLIYAFGYIASDGFIRMFNSVLASLSVILVCGTIGYYFKYYRSRTLLSYLFSLIFFVLALEVGYIRTHYLFLAIVSFEFIFFLFNKFNKTLIKKVFISLLRLTPFFVFFYHYFIAGADSRSSQVGALIKSIFQGNFYVTYSFFSSFGNIFVSNWLFPKLLDHLSAFLEFRLTEKRSIIFLFLVFTAINLYLVKKKLSSLYQSGVSIFLLGIFLYLAKRIFAYSGLVGGFYEHFSAYASIVIIGALISFWRITSHQRLAFFLLLWAAFNLVVYDAYIPIYSYPSDNRYLLHTFIPLIGLVTLYAFDIGKKLGKSLISFFLLGSAFTWGFINLFSSLSYQNYLILHRAAPSKRFFSELKSYYPTIPKGSILYFYIPDLPFALDHYQAGFGVAQMPEETAIAWRYGLDRYDFSIVNSFSDLIKTQSDKKVHLNKIFSFIASPDHLIDTTSSIRRLLSTPIVTAQEVGSNSTPSIMAENNKTVIDLKKINIFPSNISSLTGVNLNITYQASLLNPSEVTFPLEISGQPKLQLNSQERKKYLSYQNWQKEYYRSASVSATSSWKNFLAKNLLDQDFNTYWEADRIDWSDHNQGFTIDVGREILMGGIFYHNGPSSLTPTDFEIFTSMDGTNFSKAKEVKVDLKDREKVQKITFPAQKARFLKLAFHQTQYDDAPGIAEVEVIPEEYLSVDYFTLVDFTHYPLAWVENREDWNDLINSFSDRGLIKVSWKTDESEKENEASYSLVPLLYDGEEHKFGFEIPASGQVLKELILTPLTIPGKITIKDVVYQTVSFNLKP